MGKNTNENIFNDELQEEKLPLYKFEDVMEFITTAGYEPNGIVYYQGRKVLSNLPEVIENIEILVLNSAGEYKKIGLDVDEFSYKVTVPNFDGSKIINDYSRNWQDFCLERYGKEYGFMLLDYLNTEIDYNTENKLSMQKLLEYKKVFATKNEELDELSTSINNYSREIQLDENRVDKIKNYLAIELENELFGK